MGVSWNGGDPQGHGFQYYNALILDGLGYPLILGNLHIYFILLFSKSLKYLKCFNLGLLICNCYSHAIVTDY